MLTLSKNVSAFFHYQGVDISSAVNQDSWDELLRQTTKLLVPNSASAIHDISHKGDNLEEVEKGGGNNAVPCERKDLSWNDLLESLAEGSGDNIKRATEAKKNLQQILRILRELFLRKDKLRPLNQRRHTTVTTNLTIIQQRIIDGWDKLNIPSKEQFYNDAIKLINNEFSWQVVDDKDEAIISDHNKWLDFKDERNSASIIVGLILIPSILTLIYSNMGNDSSTDKTHAGLVNAVVVLGFLSLALVHFSSVIRGFMKYTREHNLTLFKYENVLFEKGVAFTHKFAKLATETSESGYANISGMR